MKHLLLRVLVALLASSVALVIADLLLDGVEVDPVGVITGAVLFTVLTVVLTLIIDALVDKHANWASWFVGLIVAFLALLITDLISEKVRISGVTTWVAATVIVWLAALATRWVLSMIIKDEPESA